MNLNSSGLLHVIAGQSRWESSLSKIYEFLKSKPCESIAPNPPSITTTAYIQDSPPADTHLTNLELSSPPPPPKSLLNGGDESCANGDRSDSSSPDRLEIIHANGDDASSLESSTNGVKQKDMRSNSASPGEVNGSESADPDKGTKQTAHFHEAGWDSFCAGFTFLRLAHINAHVQRADKSKAESLTWTDLSAALKPYENRIHISMGKFPEMNLSGKDAASKRPPLLHVEAKGGKNLDFELLQAMFAKFGTIDIKPYSHNKAMVQAPTFGWSGALLCFAGGFAILAYTGRK
ncbi:hypothetical protein B566_EDAN017714 [Ephemera danica]|nr:hypothetical protein B566_EDAN017714 [Ephemera danica]